MSMIPRFAFLTAAAFSATALAQGTLPGKPEDNGLRPVSETIYINTPEILNNTQTESLGVAIAQNGNVIVGWEDDGEGLNNLAAVWTLLDRDGRMITLDTEVTSQDPDYAGETITTKFLSFFRADGSPTPGHTAWGPKIKANLFGDGIGMGATAYDTGKEVAALAGYTDGGDWPAVQLLTGNGAPLGIVNGVPVEYAARSGNIRIGDWHYLGNSNIVIVGESRQGADLTDLYGGESPQNHVIVRVVDPTGKEVKAVQLASETPTKTEMWHGVGVTRNGFAVRFSNNGPGAIRLFDNSGTPVSTNIDLAAHTQQPLAAGGGRGDGIGFHGNGVDAYALATIGADGDGKRHVWLTVLNADGSVRWSKSALDDLELVNPGRCDVAIDAIGRVAVTTDDASGTGGGSKIVLGRVFDRNGAPLGGTFHVSEKEAPDMNPFESRNPRIAFRNDSVAVVWESQNYSAGTRVVAARLFVVPVKPGSIEAVGLTRIVPDAVVINQQLDALGNWEPYASVLGTSTFLIEANAYAENTTDKQRYVVAFQPAVGGPMKLGEGFYNDAGQPYRDEINMSRQNGNPGRVAGDTRPGAVNFMVGGETSVHAYEAFQSGNRWNGGFDRLGDGRYGTVQTFSLDTATLTQTALSKAQDSANGRLTSGGAPGNQITRFGGDIVALGNGNFVSVVEDRSGVLNAGNAAVATIFAPDGSVVKESFLVAPGDIWANVAAVKDGFVVRVQGKLYFYDNAGNAQGEPVDQDTSGESFDRGRGDGTRLAGHINSPYVVLVGKVTTGSVVRAAAWDARTRAFVAVTDVSEGGFRGDFDRAAAAMDALGRITVAWASRPDGYEQQQVATRVLVVDDSVTPRVIRPLTASFLPFVNTHQAGGIRSVGMTVAMTTKQILVAAKGEINLQNSPAQGANSPREINFYTVISHPDPKDDPTPGIGGTGPTLFVTRGVNQLTVTSNPQPLPAGFVLQAAQSANGPWTTLPNQNTPATVVINDPSVIIRAVKP